MTPFVSMTPGDWREPVCKPSELPTLQALRDRYLSAVIQLAAVSGRDYHAIIRGHEMARHRPFNSWSVEDLNKHIRATFRALGEYQGGNKSDEHCSHQW